MNRFCMNLIKAFSVSLGIYSTSSYAISNINVYYYNGNDMQLKYNIYQQVVEQLQLAQAKVQEKTPAFTVVQSASVPIRPSSRSKIMTIFIWMFLGFIVRATILGWNQLRLFITQ